MIYYAEMHFVCTLAAEIIYLTYFYLQNGTLLAI